jgi:hypothetical protein
MRTIRPTLGLLLATALLLPACAGGGATGVSPLGAGRVSGLMGPMAWADQRVHPQDVPVLGGCQVFPADNPWNTDISQAPVDPNSDNYMTAMHAATTNLHPDFGSNPHYGIPVTLAPASTPLVPMKFFLYPGQSDKGPYPFPPTARIEGGKRSHGDRHVLVVGEANCHLYETYKSYYVGPGWRAGNGAVFDLSSDALRHECWTSADAAGLPITPALPKVDEVNQGVINHAMRFTVATTQAAYTHPATHYASSNQDPNEPPMGLRVRLKASYDLSGFHGQSLVILTALKKYGAFLADNGSDWYITGATDKRWNNNDLDQMKTVPASAFEVIQLGTIYTNC